MTERAAMLDTTDYENAAMKIIQDGWSFMDCPSHCDPQKVLDMAPAFFDRRREDWKLWCAIRSGEDEYDVGMRVSTSADVNHSGQPKDDKAHLMYTDDMASLLFKQCGTDVFAGKQDRFFLGRLGAIHQEGHLISGGILSAISTVLDLDTDLGLAYQHAKDGLFPTATSATRVMQYFKAGGKSHIDRSAITGPHWGDRNGKLFAVDRKGREQIVSPPEGKVLVFASIKLQIATKGLVQAVPHGSYCTDQDRRLALVTFGQLKTYPVLKDIGLAKQTGLDGFRIPVD